MNFKEQCLLNQKNLDRVKAIEKIAYPTHMQFYGDFDDIDDVIDYADCDGQIDCIVQDDWYAIFCNGPREVEVIDLAARRSLSLSDLLVIYQKMTSFGNKIFTMNARASTSYKLIKLGEKRGMFEILLDEPNSLNGEPMHEIEFRIKPRNTFKEWFYITEAIDANTKNLLTKQKAPKDQLDSFIKELEDEPNLIDKPTAFQRFQTKFNIQKKVTAEDAQRKYFANIPNTTEEELQTYDYYKNESPQSLRQMMEQLRKFIDKKLITLKIENNIPVIYRNNQKLDTPDFSRFTSQLDSIQAELTKYSGKGNKPNPLELALSNAEHLVAKGDNIWVFKGHRPNICRILGKNQRWCISSGASAAHWFSYRIQHHQTQYFVFDFNKDENDPARYVNPGVAPEGMYSEWVDAENKHSPDPDARVDGSEVGINGYSSINEYKKYLVSKGIPLTTWTTTPPEDWEKRLHRYYELSQEEEERDYENLRQFQSVKNTFHRSFVYAKNDRHPEVFDLYLKIANRMKDSNFETLNDEQKREFLLSKIHGINEKQFDYAIENFKGEYYNSLDLDGKIQFAGRTNDQEKLLKFTKDNNLEEDNIPTFFEFRRIPHLSHLTDELIISLIDNSYIFKKLPENISGNTIQVLLQYAENKDIIAEKIIENISQFSNGTINALSSYLEDKDKDKIAELIIKKKPKLSDENVVNLLTSAKDTNKIAKLIIQNKSELSDSNVANLIAYQDIEDRDKIAEVIIKKKPELTDQNVFNLLVFTINGDKIAELIIEKKPELSDRNVIDLLEKSNYKDKIAERLGTDNISKLSDNNIEKLFDYETNKKQMALIINKYHTKKNSEIKKLIDKYLYEL